LAQSNASLAAQESTATPSDSQYPEEISAIAPFSGDQTSTIPSLSGPATDSNTSPEDLTKEFDALAVIDSSNPGGKRKPPNLPCKLAYLTETAPSTRQTNSDTQEKHSRHKDKDKSRGSDKKEKRSRHKDKDKPKSSSSASTRPALDPGNDIQRWPNVRRLTKIKEYQLADSSKFKRGRVSYL
jgi:hypothetical protein